MSGTVALRVSDKITYAQALAQSGMLPAQYRRQPANLLYAIEYAEMLGCHPLTAVTGIFVIDGKPSASAALISALVRRAGHKLRVTGDDKSATAEIIRSDDPDFTFRVTFTMDDAAKAGLAGKNVWKTYPGSMLKARAITQCARDACEDALSGLHYTAEELGAEVDEDGVPAELAVFVEEDSTSETGGAAPSTGKAKRGPLPPAENVWQGSDETWLAKWRTDVAMAPDVDTLTGLWTDLAGQVKAGSVTPADGDEGKALLAERRTELADAMHPMDRPLPGDAA